MIEERVCCIGHSVLRDITRPYLHREEIAQKDGGQLGRTSWSAVTFKADVDLYDCTGDFHQVLLKVSPREDWFFYNAKIALLPDSDLNEKHFVMVFERFEFIDKGSSGF